ncbi:hypothetical protein ACTFIZ_006177 [Dictyostelium cf. discoideum]
MNQINKFIKNIYLIIITIILIIISNDNNNNNGHFINGQSLPDGFCPQPLIYRNTTNRKADIENGYNFVGETKCLLPCPSPLFTKSQWESYFMMSLIMGSISMFASLFLIITYSPLINKKHTRHTVGILCMSIGIFFIMVSDGRQLWDMGSAGGEYSKYCPETGRYARQSDTKCLTTGLFFQFGCVTAIGWWSILAVDLWMTIAKKVQTTRKQILYYLIGINTVSLILTFGPVVKNQYGFGNAAIGCWMLDLKYQYGFFWIPVGICLSVGSVFIGLIFWEIYKISDAVKKRYLKKHIKPLCLIVLMCLEFFYMFIYYSYITANQPTYNKHVAEYIMCLIINAANVPGSYTCQLKTVSPTAQFLFLIAIRLMGLQGLIFYGLTAATKKVWANSWICKDLLKLFKFLSNKSNNNDISEIENNNNNYNNSRNYYSGSYDGAGSGRGDKFTKTSSNLSDQDINNNNINNNNNNNNNNSSSLEISGVESNNGTPRVNSPDNLQP